MIRWGQRWVGQRIFLSQDAVCACVRERETYIFDNVADAVALLASETENDNYLPSNHLCFLFNATLVIPLDVAVRVVFSSLDLWHWLL